MTLRMPFVTCLVLGLMLQYAGAAGGTSSVAAGARFLGKTPAVDDLSFKEGDMAYGLAYQYAESTGCWRLGVNYAPKASGTNDVDYVITPEIALLFSDQIWRGGLGVLRSYVEHKDAPSEWTSFYWEFILGVSVPLFGAQVDVLANYPFDDWSELNKFSFSDVELGVWVGLAF